MRKREKFLVIDTETCNSIEQPLVYDIGYAICDRFGDIVVERSFVVAETFIGLKHGEAVAFTLLSERLFVWAKKWISENN